MKKNSIETSSGLLKQITGWFFLTLGVLVWSFSSRLLIPIINTCIQTPTGASATTAGMALGIGLPFFIFGSLMLFFGWIFLLKNKSGIYSLALIFFSVAIIIIGSIFLSREFSPSNSPLSKAVKQYQNYNVLNLEKEIEMEASKKDQDAQSIKMQALIQLLLHRSDDDRAKPFLRQVAVSAKSSKVRTMAERAASN